MATKEELEAEVTRLKRENRETKEKAVKVARDAAVKHGWCHVIDQVLDDSGLLGEMEEVQVRMLVPIDVNCKVNVEGRDDMTDEEWMVWLSQQAKIQSVQWNPQGDGVRPLGANVSARDVFIGDIEVIEVGEIPPPPPRAEGAPPVGYIARFLGHEGRVRHYVRDNADRYQASLCGQPGWQGWREESSRDNGGICKRCEQRASNV